MKKQTRLATNYLTVGDMVRIPASLPAPVVYTSANPNGVTVREGKIAEKLNAGAVSVNLGGKIWDYSNREALQFQRVH